MAKLEQWTGPGTIYPNNGSSLWWKVKLPGEAKPKARPLIPDGSTKATKDPDVACAVAQSMWDDAIFKEDQKDSTFDGSLASLIQQYMTFCRAKYTSSNEAYNIELALKPLNELYPNLQAAEFDSLKLMEVQDHLIATKLARSTINKRRIPSIKKMFKWAVSRRLIPTHIHINLTTVEHIERGRHGVKHEKKVKAIPEDHVTLVLPYVTQVVADMILVHYYSGMRSSELCDMRPMDFDKKSYEDKGIWIYEYEDKMFYKRKDGEKKKIAIGPKVQKILKKYLKKRAADAYLFSPAESMEQMRIKRRENRQTKEGYGNGPGTNKKETPLSEPTEHYNKDSYRRAVIRGIDRANIALRIKRKLKDSDPDPIPRWTPHQLRHSAGTIVRAAMGLDASSAMLGHSDIDTTKLYAELQLKKAIEAAQNHG